MERDLSGTVLDGRYRLLTLLGAGGMGQVYEGKHLLLGRRVAVKVLPEHLSEDPRFRARFAREARAASKIAHLNVVQVLDFGESPEGPAYIVMEFLEGRDLRDLLRKSGRLPWPRARHILLQTVSALKAAHAHDIVHRDIKPGNCFVLDLPLEGLTDVVKVLDFGIAKVLTEFESDGLALVKPLTGTGEIMGTASYMAPEQARGEPLDARSDIYSLGIMAYEMLTGRVPFVGTNPLEVITRHLHAQPPPLRRMAHDVLLEVEEIVLRMLAKDPRDRFGSMAELETALLAIPGPILPTVRSRVSSTSGAHWGAVPEMDAVAVRKTSGPHTIHQSRRAAEEMATEPEHQGVTPCFGPLRDARDAHSVRKSRVANSKSTAVPDEPMTAAAAAPREIALARANPSSSFRLSQAITKPRPKTVPPVVEAVDPSAATMVDPGLRKRASATDERRRAQSPRPKSNRQRARPSSEPTVRTKTSTIPRLVGIVFLLGSGAALASMMVKEEKGKSPASSRAKGDAPEEPQASVMANHTAKIPGPSAPTVPKPANPKPAGAKPADKKSADAKPANPMPAGAKPADEKSADAKPVDQKSADAKPAASHATTATEPPKGDTARMRDDGSRIRDSAAAIAAPLPTEKTPSKSEQCKALRDKVQDKDYLGNHAAVIRLTSNKNCWLPNHEEEYTLLRIEALFEKDRFEECVKLGASSKNKEVVRYTKWCQSEITKK